MSFSYSPKIVTDGLVLYLDAANRNSYVSGSTRWNDLSKSGNNGTLVNGPGYSSANYGSIVFDGVNDYVNAPILPITNALTFIVWFNSSNIGAEQSFIDTGYNSGGCVFEVWNSKLNFQVYSNYIQSTTTLNNSNQTYCVAVSRVNGTAGTFYINGAPAGSTTYAALTGPTYTYIGGNLPGYNLAMIGKMYILQVYNRALSAAEVLQNYNTTKSRFGL